MDLEIEATFTDIDKNEFRAKLKANHATLIQPEIMMRRTVFDIGEHGFVRVRDEGKYITITYKVVEALTITGTKEINLKVDNYDSAVAFVEACGLKPKATQETLREKWELDGVEIDIDTWPWIPSTVDIEGPSTEAVTAVSEKLGFNMNDAHYGSIDEIYKLYYDVTNDDINYCPEIKFTDIPDWLEAKRLKHP